MGCTTSKDAVETNSKPCPAKAGWNMSMPVQTQGNSDNGYHMVALTSSTYGILKVSDPKISVNSVSLSSSPDDAFYEKLKHFDVPDEMLTKSWSEVSRNLPKIPPPSKTGSPRRTDSLRRMDSPRLQTRGLDSPRHNMSSFRGTDSPWQRGSFRQTDSPRLVSSQVAKNDHETINTWELMDGLDEDRNALAKRIPGPPVIKPFERSVTFSTIHTLSELDSGDPSKAIAPGPAGNFLNSTSLDGGGKNTNPVRGMSRSASSPMVPTRDEVTVGLMPSSPSPAARVSAPSSDSPRPQQHAVTPMTLTIKAIAAIQEVNYSVSESIPRPPSPSLRSIGIKKGSESPHPRQPTAAARTVSPGFTTCTLNEGSSAASKSHLPSPSPLLRSTGTNQSNDSPSPRQQATASMMLASEVNGSLLEGSNSGGKSYLPSPSPLLKSVGAKQICDYSRSRLPVTATTTVAPVENDIQEGSNVASKSYIPPLYLSSRSTENRNASVMPVRNRSPGSKPYRSPMVKAVDSPMSLNTKLEADLKLAITGERGVSSRQSFSKQSGAKISFEPDSGRVCTVAASLTKEGAVAHPQQTLRRVEADESSNQPNSQVPRFASPIHVLSLAASFDLENRKNFMSNIDLQAPPGQAGRRSFSKQQSMPTSSMRATPPSGQEVSSQSQAFAPNHDSHGSLDTLNVSVRSQKGSSLLDSDLLASFEEALEMLSTDKRQNVRDSKGEIASISGVIGSKRSMPMDTNGISYNGSEEGVSGDRGRQDNGNKEINARLASQVDRVSLKSSAIAGAAPREIARPEPWARFELKCPPAGEDRVVLYTTSLRGIRKTFEDCNNARFIFKSFNLDIDERDVSIHAEFRRELMELAENLVSVPQAFIKGRYIGGMDTITQLHENGTLATFVEGLPLHLSRGECDGCGGIRFVPCSDCSGSTKIVNEAKEVMRCSECNENGLMRCPICY